MKLITIFKNIHRVAVKMEDFESGTPRPRRYRNRRIGDFLKELDLTEGKSTGITTVRSKLKSNGSPAAIYEFDDERTWFCATIKIHPEFPKVDEGQNVPQNVLQNVAQNVPQKTFSEREQKVLDILISEPTVSTKEIGIRLGVSDKTIKRTIAYLRLTYSITWDGPAKSGHWEVGEIK